MAIYLYVLQLHDAFGMIGQKGLEAPCRDYDFESKGSKIQCQELDNGSTLCSDQVFQVLKVQNLVLGFCCHGENVKSFNLNCTLSKPIRA